MENAADALVMAGAVLIFIIALTVSMSSFTTMRSQIDEITQAETKLELVKDDQGYMNYQTATGTDVRIVGAETVVSSLYRIAKENYIVYIKTDDTASAKTINLKTEQTYKNIDGTEPTIISTTDDIIKVDINENNSDINKLLDDDGLYKKIKNKHFYEYLGVYQENTAADESNRTTYRVITYIEKQNIN